MQSMAQQNGALSEDEELSRLGRNDPSSPAKSQRVLYEQAWGAHEPNLHPDTLKLHVERRTRNQHVRPCFALKQKETLYLQ